MLTKEIINVMRLQIGEGDCNFLREICGQAALACDLQAEVDRLKAEYTELDEAATVLKSANDIMFAENERLKGDIARIDIPRIVDNLLEMERINRMADLQAENERLKETVAKIKAWCERDYFDDDESEGDEMKYSQGRILQIIDRTQPPKEEQG